MWCHRSSPFPFPRRFIAKEMVGHPRLEAHRVIRVSPFLATLFSKVLQSSHLPPRTWCTPRLLPIHKNGDLSKPENFRPIALTSAVGKLFHSILSERLEQYILDNGVVDPSLQKSSLRGINGCVEHIFALQQIFSNVKEHSLPFSLSFIDLKNAFG